MADITIDQVRAKYPQYKDMSDQQLAEGLHKKFYSDMPIEDFNKKIGLSKTPSEAEEKPKPSFLGLKDLEGEAKIRGVKAPSITGSMLAPSEALLSMVSGAIGKPVSDIFGMVGAGMDWLNNEHSNRPEEFRKHIQQAMTYQPRHIEGEVAAQYNPLALLGKAGGAVSDKLGDLVSGDKTSFARELAGNVVREALPQALSIAGAKYGPTSVKKTTDLMRKGTPFSAEELMQSALKPPTNMKALKSGDAKVAIDTMLDNNIPLSKKGVDKLYSKIDELNDQISDAIKNSKGTVGVSDALPMVKEKLDQFKMQVNPDADVAAVKQAWEEFKKNPIVTANGGRIPLPVAQEMKQGTYQQLKKKYGQVGTASDETQKAIARALKEGIAKNAPEVAQLNKEESRLLRTLPIVERRVLMDANKNPMGLSLLTADPKAWAAFMADRSAGFKSLIARIINGSRPAVESTGKAAIPGIAASNYLRPPTQDKNDQTPPNP